MICHWGEKETRVLREVVIIDFKKTLPGEFCPIS